jgi:hypothetical protein
MIYQEALTKLRNHSNLTRGGDDQSLLHSLWQADREVLPLDLSPSVENILACLAVANLELNGYRPSETFDRHHPTVISDLAYPVSGLVVGLLKCHRRWSASGRFPPRILDALRDAALRIGLAWDMLLAGDHDDLRNELEVEWNAAV